MRTTGRALVRFKGLEGGGFGVSDVKTYVYKPFVLASLGHHGLIPNPTTTPARLREFLNDLYRYELRQLRAHYVRHEFSKLEYHARVTAVRKRYPLMSYPVECWTE